MAPSKFVAPLKRSGGLSSSFSSTSSIASVCQDAKPAAVAVPIRPKQPAALNPPKKAAGSKQKQVSTGGNPAAKQGKTADADEPPKRVKENTEKSDDGSKAAAPSKGMMQAPQKKKRKIEFAAPSSSSSSSAAVRRKHGDGGDDDEDKENVRPNAAKRMKLEMKRPFVSLSNSDYESLFQAVLERNQSGDSLKEAGGSNTKPPPQLEESSDLFEFSQSDLDDLDEDEQTGPRTSKKTTVPKTNKKDKTTASSGATNDQLKQYENLTPSTPLNTTVDLRNGISQEPAVSSPIARGRSHEDLPATPLQQERGCTSGAQAEEWDGKSLTETLSAQVSSVRDFENVVTSTPQAEKRTNLISSPFATPQERNQALRVALSPLAPIAKTSAATPSSVTSALPQSNSGTPKSTFSVTKGSQSSVAPKSPTSTPNRSSVSLSQPFKSSQEPSLSQPFKSSQEPRTPVCTPSRPPVSQSGQSSRHLHTPIRTPIKPALSVSNLGSPAPSTPSGSQPLCQVIQQTPPPPEVTAKERLLWLQKKRLAGLWVQCDSEDCKKWRYLKDIHDPTDLPDRWFCRMHPDPEFNICEAPEKRLPLLAEEDMVFNKFSPGSLVWAKLSGYPWWPAMVEDDPDLEQFYWLNLFSDIPTWYHVVFFDEDGKNTTCCRAWVQVERLKSIIEDQHFDNENITVAGYKRRIAAAYKKARRAQLLNIEDRLAQHSFATNYQGPIGGFKTKKYIGPLGDRKLIPA